MLLATLVKHDYTQLQCTCIWAHQYHQSLAFGFSVRDRETVMSLIDIISGRYYYMRDLLNLDMQSYVDLLRAFLNYVVILTTIYVVPPRPGICGTHLRWPVTEI